MVEKVKSKRCEDWMIWIFEKREIAFKEGRRLRDDTAVNPLETRPSRKVQEIVIFCTIA